MTSIIFNTPHKKRIFFRLFHTPVRRPALHFTWSRLIELVYSRRNMPHFSLFFPPRVPISRRSVLYSDSAVYINNKPRSTRKKKKYTPGFCGRSVGLLSTGAATFYQIGLRFPSVDSILLCCEWERFFLSLPPPLKCVTKLTRDDALPVAI